jgi:D-glycero-alpha-D-manno-heptose 1-phosphate guanylyltransferase
VNDAHITHFAEKGPSGSGLINGGVYGLNVPWFWGLGLPPVFSMETDFFYPKVAALKPHYVTTDGYFLDIGVPEDYERAQSEIPLREIQDKRGMRADAVLKSPL